VYRSSGIAGFAREKLKSPCTRHGQPRRPRSLGAEAPGSRYGCIRVEAATAFGAAAAQLFPGGSRIALRWADAGRIAGSNLVQACCRKPVLVHSSAGLPCGVTKSAGAISLVVLKMRAGAVSSSPMRSHRPVAFDAAPLPLARFQRLVHEHLAPTRWSLNFTLRALGHHSHHSWPAEQNGPALRSEVGKKLSAPNGTTLSRPNREMTKARRLNWRARQRLFDDPVRGCDHPKNVMIRPSRSNTPFGSLITPFASGLAPALCVSKYRFAASVYARIVPYRWPWAWKWYDTLHTVASKFPTGVVTPVKDWGAHLARRSTVNWSATAFS
jgi:hypothetical protein